MAVFCFSAVAYACDFCISYNYYMFSVINRNEFVAQDNVGFVKFWKSYTNGVATQSDVEKLGTMGYENFKKRECFGIVFYSVFVFILFCNFCL